MADFGSKVNDLYQALGTVAEERNEEMAVVHTAALHMACVSAISGNVTEEEFVTFARKTFRSAVKSRPVRGGIA